MKITETPRIDIEMPWSDLFRFVADLAVRKSPEEASGIIGRFEVEFGRRYGFPGGVALSKARMAFYFLLRNLGLKPGGEVLISAIHVGDYVNMIILAGFKPVVVDLEADSFSISFEDLEKKLNPNSALILITHLYGYATDMDRVRGISEKYGVPFIEDCSQTVNTFYKGNRLGTFGLAAIFSLTLIKPICTIFGGMLISGNQRLLDAVRRDAASLGSPPRVSPLFFEAVKHLIIKTAVSAGIFRYLVFPLIRLTMPLGDYFAKYQKHNKTVGLRATIPVEFFVKYSWQQARMGLSQLADVDPRGAIKASAGKKLHEMLKKAPCPGLPKEVEGSENSFWLFPLLVENPEKLKRILASNGLDGATMLLSALSSEKAFALFGFSAPNAERWRAKTVFVPVRGCFSDSVISDIGNIVSSGLGVAKR